MNKNTTEEAFNYLMSRNNLAIIYGVLKKLNVNKNIYYYQDLFQEGVITFVEAYLDYDGEMPKFGAYAYQRIYWRLLDLLRRQSYADKKFSLSSDKKMYKMMKMRPRNILGWSKIARV
ncbi:MAG: sigma factor [Limosilactobacillus sp.]|uniref:sigma factor n=1 Tax=Limosilactobacillus sp. TaxID=2773925 RepID=UPI0027100441|nr:sigma factor [Limosilactobacillus sp.]